MKKLLPLAIVPLAFMACKKDTPPIDNTPIPEQQMVAMPLKEGNYWVYDHYKVDTNGVETYLNTDSLYVQGTQIINGDTFYVIKGSNYFLLGFTDNNGNVFMKDSLRYLINKTHGIYYSPLIGDTINVTESQPVVNTYTYMAYKDSVWITPAGTFTKTATLLTTAIYNQPMPYWGTRRDALIVYADSIGLIMSRYFYAAPPEYWEYRLVRYHVE